MALHSLLWQKLFVVRPLKWRLGQFNRYFKPQNNKDFELCEKSWSAGTCD